MKVLVTGTAGFIGFHVANKLIEQGYTVVGLDSINDYYDTGLKYDRLLQRGIQQSSIEYGVVTHSITHSNYSFIQLKLEDKPVMDHFFEEQQFDIVINLAAQAGVRYSLSNPHAYIDSNIVGFTNILEGCRHTKVKHLVYASSSSVYGLNEDVPFSTSQNVDHPMSLYAASKKSNELMAHVYSHLFGLPTTGLRFFTVYGPWGRPDMALFIFAKAILEGKPIQVFNNGDMVRDFTYVDDIVSGVTRVMNNVPTPKTDWDPTRPESSTSAAPYQLYNIGNNSPVKLLDFITAIEDELGMKGVLDFQPIQPGDVPSTYADVTDLVANVGYKPDTTIQKGIKEFIGWYRSYYKK